MISFHSQHKSDYQTQVPKIQIAEKVKKNVLSELASCCEQIMISLIYSTDNNVSSYFQQRLAQKKQNQQQILNEMKCTMQEDEKGYVPLTMLLQHKEIKSIIQELIPLNEICSGLSRKQLAIGLLRRSIQQHSKKLWVNYRSVRLLNPQKIFQGSPEKLKRSSQEQFEQCQDESEGQEHSQCTGSYEILQSVKRLQINPYISHQTGPKQADPSWESILNYDNSAFFN